MHFFSQQITANRRKAFPLRVRSLTRGYAWLVAILLACSPNSPAQHGSPTTAVVTAREDHLVVVTNPKNPVSQLSWPEIKKIFLGEKRTWPNGRKITIAVRSPGHVERDVVLREIYNMSEAEYHRHFLHAAFTGEIISSPKQLDTAMGMKRFIFNVPGAIGYLRASEVDSNVKVIGIEGLAPGDRRYPLRISSAPPEK
jgi:ABC-type phosphate transport system substrate-binding protein